MTSQEPVQFTISREDKLREEFTEKLNKLDEKIDHKVPNMVFYSLITLLIGVFGGVMGYAYFLINQHDNNLNQTNISLAHLETKVDMSSKKN